MKVGVGYFGYTKWVPDLMLGVAGLMVFSVELWKIRRVCPGEVREGHFWPRKQYVQRPGEKRERAQSSV